MPLDQALTAVADQADDARASRVYTAVRTQVAGGATLAAALAQFPRTFSDLYRGLVAVAAETGQLPTCWFASPTIWKRGRRAGSSSRWRSSIRRS
jgi:general secretion pathway protein F